MITEPGVESLFASDVELGLSAPKKWISSRYFYDKTGDEIFRRIMEMPEYYVTRCEYEIFQTYKEEIFTLMNAGSFEIVEFGAGDAYKTKVLLRHFCEKGSEINYIPIDISANALSRLTDDLAAEMPFLLTAPLEDEYFHGLNQLNSLRQRKLVLFLGSNIGNFTEKEALAFVGSVYENLNQGDLFLIGVDLKKDPAVVLRAYNDVSGITASFNMNLLYRINTELGGNFDLRHFYHFPVYDPSSGTAKSFLVSKADQDVYIKALEKTFHFWNGEEIATEISQKYELSQLKDWGKAFGFELAGLFMDSKSYFADIIFRK